ncbi:unnamed protein product [Amoebophrya sp. A25]|nr:unnamed protein product [Amoebophrya sp. A25]|eukprot:GSA25T00012189001.1
MAYFRQIIAALICASMTLLMLNSVPTEAASFISSLCGCKRRLTEADDHSTSPSTKDTTELKTSGTTTADLHDEISQHDAPLLEKEDPVAVAEEIHRAASGSCWKSISGSGPGSASIDEPEPRHENFENHDAKNYKKEQIDTRMKDKAVAQQLKELEEANRETRKKLVDLSDEARRWLVESADWPIFSYSWNPWEALSELKRVRKEYGRRVRNMENLYLGGLGSELVRRTYERNNRFYCGSCMRLTALGEAMEKWDKTKAALEKLQTESARRT